jgi:hypothetical protein
MEMRVVAVEIHEETLFARTGLVGRWASSVARELKSNTIREAPRGRDSGRINKSRANAGEPEGSLKRGIRSSTRRTGPTSLEITLESTASYSTYVLKGTRTVIAASARIPRGEPGAGQFRDLRGEDGERFGMYLPANPGFGRSKFVQRRRGQRANNFMQRGVTKTAVRHESLRGFKMV